MEENVASEQDNGLSPLKRALLAIQDLTAKLEAAKRAKHEPIAIVGMACRFPGGANDPASYWRLLREGCHAVGEVPADRWDVDAYFDPDPDAPGKTYTRMGGFLDRPIDRFDARFFGITPREAPGMDPQQRLLLELAWESLENAGLAPDKLQGSPTGVFVGISATDFGMLDRGRDLVAQIDPYSATGSAFSVAAGRISHLLGLRGPTLALDTACSSSLVAVHLACESLRAGRSSMALAGGVNLMLVPHGFVGMCKLRALAPDGRCKTFDAGADGYVRGEGGGVVVLKRLSDALAAGDSIHAVIRGTAVNHDGRSSGLTVPNAAAQQAVIRAAIEDAGLSPEQVDYVEAHGTGTELGDPIEIRALSAVLGRGRSKENPLAVGSAKTNFGHLEAAAGIAGLIKLVLSLAHEAIPPHLHLERPTPHVDWDELPLVIPTTLTPWPRGERPRVGGVSSFGFSGTNAHIVLEEAPVPVEREARSVESGAQLRERPAHLLPLSARSPEALRELASRYDARLEGAAGPLADLCFSAAEGRTHFEHRLAVVGRTAEEMCGGLGSFLRGEPEGSVHTGHAAGGAPPRVAFLFTGQGAQYVGMGRQLYESEPVFRAAMERCGDLLRPYLERPLLSVLYPDPEGAEAAERLVHQTAYTQPALFAVEYALAQLWRSWGIEPTLVTGHSVGEYVAACVAGVFRLEDGLRLIAARGRLMQSLPEGGSMAAVFADERRVAAAIAPHAGCVSVAAINGPENVVISGEGAAVRSILSRLQEEGIRSRPITVSHAFHSTLMEPMLEAFAEAAASVEFSPPRIGLVSNLSGRLAGEEIARAAYWREHVRAPVRFADALATLRAEGCTAFLEIGPSPTLLGLARRCLAGDGETLHLPSLRPGRGDSRQMLDSLAALYTAGAGPNWSTFHEGRTRGRVVLPTYPFQGERYWPATSRGEWVRVGEEEGSEPSVPADWLYQLHWRTAPRAPLRETEGAAEPGHWLILADRGGCGAALARSLEAQGDGCTLVLPGEGRPSGSSRERHVDPADATALRTLVVEATAGERPLRGVLHLWSLDIPPEAGLDALARAQALGSAAVLPLAQGLASGASRAAGLPRLWVITRGAQAAGPGPTPAGGALQAPLWGLGKTISLEHPEFWGGLVDLDPEGSPVEEESANLLAEIRRADGEQEIAFRRGERQVARVVPAREGVVPPHGYRPRPDGAYLVTGGLGGLGLEVARWLAGQGARRLILLGRTPLPPRAAWRQVPAGPLAGQIQAILELEALGTSVHTAAVDVGDEARLRAFLTTYADEGWPPIRGVVHAAGINQDVTLRQMDTAELQAVLHSKVRGGWLLHHLLQDAPLDFFVCFSSASSLTGSSRLGGYAAANAFLDALVHHRRGRGLPGLTINWGPWADVGMAARADLDDQQARTGMGGIPPRQGVQLLGRLLTQGEPRLGVLPIPPSRLRRLFPTHVPWLAELPLEDASADHADGQAVGERILAAAGEERRGLMLDHLRRRVARITLTDPGTIAAEHSVMQLGMDSLMIMELVRELNRDLRLTLYPREIFEQPSLAALGDHLLVELEKANGVVPESDPLASASPVSRSTGPSADALPAIRPGARDGALPLSFAQQRLFFLHQLEPGAATYNMPVAIRLSGTLDAAALEESVRVVLQRHESLRSSLVLRDGTPYQEIAPLHGFALPVDDLSVVPAQEREASVRERIRDEVRRPFDLRSDLKLRARLLRSSEKEHVLVLTVHHVASDGTSLGILVHELATLYEAFSAGEPSPLPPLPIQYADYALWQRKHLQGDALDDQLAYWKRQLTDAPVLELPTDRPRPTHPTHRGASESLLLPARLSDMLAQLSRQENVTLFMTLLAGFQLLLSRLSGQDDVVVGTPISGRHHGDTEGLIGLFLNNLALRTDLAGDPSFRGLLERVRGTTMDAYANQDIPFEKLIEELQPARDLNRTPFFQVLFNMLPARTDERLRFGEAAAEVVVDIEEDAKFDFTLYVAEGSALRLQLNYNTDLFDAGRMRELLRQYELLLEQVVAAPDQAVSRFHLRTAAAEAALPDPRAALPPMWAGSIPARVSATAQRAPDRPALRDERETWSYAELEEASSRLANRLLAEGVARADAVALYAERDASLVVALIGVLKAGAAFVILDPADPAARLAARLRQASPRAWLQLEAAGELPEGVRPLAEALPCRLTLPWEKAGLLQWLAGDSAEGPPVEIGPDDLAYVAFTSGTTGEPKGILGTHRPLSHFLKWHADTFGFTAADRFSVLSGLAHDPLLRDLFAPLWVGATVCIPSPATREEPRTLFEWLQRERITTAHLTPAMGEVIGRGAEAAGDAAGLPALRYAFFGGDVLTLRQVMRLRGTAPAVKCVNYYGATETPQGIAFHEVESEEVEEGASAAGQVLPLGRGIEGVQLLVLGDSDRLCGIGELGEICVRTPYLARGYLADEALTERRFVVNPFTGVAQDRIYRTGDRGRYLANGIVAFAGRVDTQVKVRGYRVEPGEIEAVLTQHPAVRQAVVLEREGASGQRQLVACVTAAGQTPSPAELREHLRNRLPEYMVPAAFAVVERIPLTRGGKVDRRALQAMASDPAQSEEPYQAPRTPVEELLAGFWQELLGVDRVGIHESFYDLGGHSLLAMQLVSRIRAVLQVELPLRALFDVPTVAGLAQRVEALRGRGGAPEAPPLVPVPRVGPMRLSFAQQRLWFLEQLEDLGPAYHISSRLRLQGDLDRAALLRALDRIVGRHEALRTTFRLAGGEPEQVVAPAEESGFHRVEHDLCGHAEPRDELRRVMAEEAGAPFDLERGPLVRGRLVRLAADDHVLLVTMHHIVSDGWSMGVFMRELGTLYGAFRRGEPDPLPPLPVQYADYAAWQRRWVSGEVLRQQAEYWERTLGGAPERLELSTDHPRPARQDYTGGAVGLELGEELTAGLRELGRRHGATLFMTLLAGWAAVLGRLAGQSDVVVGTPTASRGQREIEGLIGFFVNTLALRVELSDSPSGAELLARVKDRVLEAQQNQDIPFEQVVERVRPVRSLAHTPLFQVMLTWQNAFGGGVPVPGLTAGPVPGEAAGVTAKFDLSLALQEAGDRIVGGLVYAVALFEPETMERQLGYLRRMLEGMVADESRPVAHLELMGEVERRQVLERWGAVPAPYPPGACVHELFQAQAARTPHAVAVAWRGERTTYAELERRTGRLARVLRAEGVGPERVVGIYMEHSADAVVALLATLRAGGCALLLDPGHPPARTTYLLEDACAALVVSQPHVSARLPRGGTVQRVLEPAWESLAEEGDGEDGPLLPLPDPESAAYVVYTSGSTGEPKGVLVPHRAAAVHLAEIGREYGLSPEDRVLAFAAQTFDPFLEQVLAPLLVGASVALRGPDVWAPDEFAARVEALGLTVANVTPAYFAQLVSEPPVVAALRHGLRLVIVGGEALPPAAVLAWEEGGVGAPRLLNAYGPTEAVMTATLYEAEGGRAAAWGAAVPIGGGVCGRRVYVLDARGEPVPVGVPGELYLGGECLARGYLGRPELTADRFVPDPFAEVLGARMYRTGDRVRGRVDGELEFLGRIDSQVKVRGFRIEPGEIEARLREHPWVREAVVVAREDAPGERRLVAYCVGDEAAEAGEVDAQALRTHLGARLPEYMVPAAYVRLDRLPLTSSGKVDRRTLPAPEGDVYAAREYEAPEGRVEEAVAGIWAALLRVERVGRRDGFFELGGHSLLAVQVVSRVRQELGVEVPLSELFVRPVLADFARAVEGAVRTELPPIEPVERTGAGLPLSFAQQRLWFLQQLEPASTAYNLHGSMHLRGALDLEALRWSFDEVVRRHETLRTVFRQQDGEPVQVVLPPAPAALEVVDLRELPEEEREAQVRDRTRRAARVGFDLERGPLLRVWLLRLGEEEHVLLVTMHHIVTDGWSLRLLTRELRTHYEAFRRAEPASLAELEVQYADYAAWQREHLRNGVLDAQLAYWRERLADVPALVLPTDRPRPPVQSYRGAAGTMRLPVELSEALRQLSRREGATLFMTLLAGFQLLLSRLSGQDDVVVGSPIAGRTRMEIEPLLGFFLNSLVLRTDLSGDPSFRELLARVREVTLGAYAHQEIPFEKLVEELKPPRDLSRTPFFQVLFNMLPDGAGERLDFGGVVVEPLGAAEVEAKFDLTLYLVEDAGIMLRLVYNTDLFDAARIERLLRCYATLLEAAVREPQRRISTLPLLPEAERAGPPPHLPRIAPGPSFAEFPAEALEHSLGARFAGQVARAPQAIAVETVRHRWSYAELERRANQVAHAILRRCGAGEGRVALLLEHDAPMLAALLGVLQAGKAYVPLDPSFPPERLRRLLHDAGAGALLTQASLVVGARAWAGGTPLLELEEVEAGESGQAVDLEVSPATPAYILYTSGSTGEPKGVVQCHRNVLHHIRTYTNRLRLGAGDRLSLLSSYGSDAAVMDIFGALLNGAVLCPIDLKGEAAGGLPGQLAGRGITVYHSTPTVYRHLLAQMGGGEDLSRIRLVVLGGEEATARDVELFRRHFASEALLINGMGPTECTLAMQQVVGRETELPGGRVPVGSAVEGVEVLLLNAADEPVETYATGEIVLRSAYLALGYWGREEQTRAAFAPDPDGGERRIYRTGDLGRRLPDGRIVFAGRKDFQLKIRGHRVEAGEIESALLRCTGVRQAVVLTREGTSGGRQLVAYLALEPGSPPALSELRDHLRAILPEHMVPAGFVTVERLPLTRSGKVDRRALAALEPEPLAAVADFVAPSTPMERLIAEIWRDLLQEERIGVRDNFYDLGGHSLLSIRFASRFHEATGIRIDLREVTYQTLGQLAATYTERVAVPSSPSRWSALVATIRGRLQRAVAEDPSA